MGLVVFFFFCGLCGFFFLFPSFVSPRYRGCFRVRKDSLFFLMVFLSPLVQERVRAFPFETITPSPHAMEVCLSIFPPRERASFFFFFFCGESFAGRGPLSFPALVIFFFPLREPRYSLQRGCQPHQGELPSVGSSPPESFPQRKISDPFPYKRSPPPPPVHACPVAPLQNLDLVLSKTPR